jgi:hypothetical protein
LRQVEINTVAASFGCLATRVSALHAHCAREFKSFEFEFGATADSLPSNRAEEGLAETLAEAWREYGAPHSAIVFLIQSPEKNRYDQLHLQHVLSARFGIATFRKTLAEMSSDARRDPVSNRLLLKSADSENGLREVAVVYFRAGYGPGDYTSESDWAARREIELSFSVKVWRKFVF